MEYSNCTYRKKLKDLHSTFFKIERLMVTHGEQFPFFSNHVFPFDMGVFHPYRLLKQKKVF